MIKYWEDKKRMVGPFSMSSGNEIRIYLFHEPRITFKESINLGDVRINTSFLNRGFVI